MLYAYEACNIANKYNYYDEKFVRIMDCIKSVAEYGKYSVTVNSRVLTDTIIYKLENLGYKVSKTWWSEDFRISWVKL